jgi:hypothetical protein
MNWTERVSQIVNGAKVLGDWIGHGGIPVEKEVAQARADICLKCPMNVRDWPLLESVAAAIKKQIGLKNHLQLRVTGEKGLHFCASCGCVNKLKIWLPLENILPEPDERVKFDPNCWLLK